MTNHNGSRGDSRKDCKKDDIEDQLVAIDRIAKVVKGGRRMKFTAIAIVGDKKGHVGFGTDKTQEVPEAIHKAVKTGKERMIRIPIAGTTIPHEVMGHCDSGSIMLEPAEADSGIAADDTVRIIMDLAGISDVISKSPDSNTPVNVIRAIMGGLSELKTHEDVLKLRESAKGLGD